MPQPGQAAFRLRDFRPTGYDKGRPLFVQAAWFATLHLVFLKWWFPSALRPPVLRAFGASIGRRVLIRHGVRVHWPWKLTIGDDCWIGEGVWILNLESVTLAHDVCLSQESLLCTGSHDRRTPDFAFDNAPIAIGAHSWVCSRAIVLRGVELPPSSLVPAGTVRAATDGRP